MKICKAWLPALLLVLVLSPSPAMAQGGEDVFLLSGSGGTSDWQVQSLPRNQTVEQKDFSPDDVALAWDDSRQQPIALINLTPPALPQSPIYKLFALDEVSHPTRVLTIPLGEENALPLMTGERPRDMAITPDGRYFVLLDWSSTVGGPREESRLLEVNPETAATIERWALPDRLDRIAYSPRGLWMIQNQFHLLHFTPSVGAVDDTGITLPFFSVGDVDVDSTGALWLMTEELDVGLSFQVQRLDPVTGAFYEGAGLGRLGVPRIAIARRCTSSSTARCLRNGRFRAEIHWRDYQNREGQGQVAPSASADSVLFWFFEPSNWEVLVKVIDGCNRNGHYWVFSAGTTDVEYTLEVTDLLTGEVFTADNPLGRAAPAVTEGRAFPCAP